MLAVARAARQQMALKIFKKMNVIDRVRQSVEECENDWEELHEYIEAIATGTSEGSDG